MKSSLWHLPEDIVENILLRLAPKSLQFSCKLVCKSWYAMIRSPNFINKQLNFSIANNKHPSPVTFFFIWRKQGPPLLKTKHKQVLSMVTIHDKDDGDCDHLPRVIEEITFPPVPETEKADFPVNLSISHCNGIIFFCDRDSLTDRAFVLCNPELGEFKLLHTPSLPSHEFIFSGAGFGYDLKANDYKCVKLFCSVSSVEVNRAMVYSLTTDSWREVKISLNGKCCYVDDAVYLKGVCYWWNMGIENSETMILSFDFSTEEFHTIELPQHAKNLRGKLWKLDVWNESIVLFITTERSHSSRTFEMWVMVENFGGVEGFTYWTKHLTIGPLGCILIPLAFWKDDELLMETRDDRLVSYNLRTQKSRKFYSRVSVLRGRINACLYPKSLVSFKRGNMLNRI